MGKLYLNFVGLHGPIYEPCGYDIKRQGLYSANGDWNPGLEQHGPLYPIFSRPLQPYSELQQNMIGCEGWSAGNWGTHTGGDNLLWMYRNPKPWPYFFTNTSPHSQSANPVIFPALMTHRNGASGWPGWKSLRQSDNPLTRRQIQNNILTVCGERGTFNNNGVTTYSRLGIIERFDEPAVVANKPLLLKMRSRRRRAPTGRGANLDSMHMIPVNMRFSFENETELFSNTRINEIIGKEPKSESSQYTAMKRTYLDDGLSKFSTPFDSFISFTYSKDVYPKDAYANKSYTRDRSFFRFLWNSDKTKRDMGIISTSTPYLSESLIGQAFGFQTDSAPGETYDGPFGGNMDGRIRPSVKWHLSVWPMDAGQEWLDWPSYSSPLSHRLGWAQPYVGGGAAWHLDGPTGSYGILQNTICNTSWVIPDVTMTHPYGGSSLSGRMYREILYPAPLYSRRHTLYQGASYANPSGLDLADHDLTGSSPDFDDRYGGDAWWDTPEQSGQQPFHNSYAEYAEHTRIAGKGYTIVPEYKISNFVERYENQDVHEPVTDFLHVSGGEASFNTSDNDEFYKIYSTSDIMHNFDVIVDDHKEFAEPSRVKLTCKAVTKFLPYSGFYPMQRMTEMSFQFFNSYWKNVYALSGAYGATSFDNLEHGSRFPHGYNFLMRPLFAPGVLFNTIKSGIACDYPILTGSATFEERMIANTSFDDRIPFEAAIEPHKHLANKMFVNMEPDALSNYTGSSLWDGRGDALYAKMANNFLAEVPNFFLANKQPSAITSKQSSDPSFGNVDNTKTYGMRVKMYRSMEGPLTFVTGAQAGGRPYKIPQDLIKTGLQKSNETITMYSRPSAFGPPCGGYVQADFNATHGTNGTMANFETQGFTTHYASNEQHFYKDSRHGFNFPYTPPYYHGEAWADIEFKPTQTRKYSVSEIIASSSIKYYRFWTGSYAEIKDARLTENSIEEFSVVRGPQNLRDINDNAMQISASLNLFGIANLGEFNQNPVSDPNEPARWVIQTKMETPILNFAKYEDKDTITTCKNASSASIPRGMWHQYGEIPSGSKGVFMQVTDIPNGWQEAALRRDLSTQYTSSLADVCGFNTEPVRLGKLALVKRVKEAVVVIPYIEESGGKKFFTLKKEKDPDGRKTVEMAVNILQGKEPGPLILASGIKRPGDSVIQMIKSMQDFIFPPTMDFITYPDKVDPFIMYVFEFSRNISRKGLQNIWQGVMPPMAHEIKKSTVEIEHSLLANELLNQEHIKNHNLKWMVFKVKQRAKTNYYDNIYTQAGNMNRQEVRGTRLTAVEMAGATLGKVKRDKISYNWPYDFFSIVELVKVGVDVEFSEREEEEETGEVIEVSRGNVAMPPGRRAQGLGTANTVGMQVPALQAPNLGNLGIRGGGFGRGDDDE